MTEPRRRATDRRSNPDRRHQPDRRAAAAPAAGRMRYPSWPEQQVQFVTRYVFWVLGILFFNFVEGIEPARWSLAQVNGAFAAYFLLNTAFFWHATPHPANVVRYRLAMWVDILITSIAVLNDPYAIPPSILVYIMVVLGNGMRYGMRLFAEALAGSFTAAMVVLSIRYMYEIQSLSPGLLFLNLFGAIILVYAYILMSRIERSRTELEQSSNLDTLTGLYNRRALLEIADGMFRQLGRGRRGFVMLFADLDKFKAINDEFGHAAGDLVLKQFADILRRTLRGGDVAARYGGDEFVIFLDDTDIAEAEQVAIRIQTQVTGWARANGMDFSVTFGLGEAPTHGNSFAVLLEQVDKALYHSKSTHTGGGLAHAEKPLIAVAG